MATLREVSQVTGLTPARIRQLVSRSGYEPMKEVVSGTDRDWTYYDMLRLRVIHDLTELGVSVLEAVNCSHRLYLDPNEMTYLVIFTGKIVQRGSGMRGDDRPYVHHHGCKDVEIVLGDKIHDYLDSEKYHALAIINLSALDARVARAAREASRDENRSQWLGEDEPSSE